MNPTEPQASPEQIGRLFLERAIRSSLLLPREQHALDEILTALHSADLAAREMTDYPALAGTLTALLDSYRRALRDFGTPQ